MKGSVESEICLLERISYLPWNDELMRFNCIVRYRWISLHTGGNFGAILLDSVILITVGTVRHRLKSRRHFVCIKFLCVINLALMSIRLQPTRITMKQNRERILNWSWRSQICIQFFFPSIILVRLSEPLFSVWSKWMGQIYLFNY